MYFLDNLENCHFARYPCSIKLSEMLRKIRRTEWANMTDSIAVQAALELANGNSEFGPFSVMITEEGGGENKVRIYKDSYLILDLEIKETDVTILYLKEDREALEELCQIADARATLETGH